MTTAFVLTGGGSLGAVQVGMLQALGERGIRPDILIGTSAGAINAAFVASNGMDDEALTSLADIWIGLRRSSIFPVDPLRQILAFTGSRPSLCSNSAVSALIKKHLTFELLEDAPIPLHVLATNLLDGDDILLSTGDALSAILASSAIPGVFPTIQRDGRTLIDGGFANYAGLSESNALGADEVYVLLAGSACSLEKPPAGALAVAVHALSVLISHRLVTEFESLAKTTHITVLPSPCPQTVSAVDFRHAKELIDSARRQSGAYIDAGGIERADPIRPLVLHHHESSESPSQDT